MYKPASLFKRIGIVILSNGGSNGRILAVSGSHTLVMESGQLTLSQGLQQVNDTKLSYWWSQADRHELIWIILNLTISGLLSLQHINIKWFKVNLATTGCWKGIIHDYHDLLDLSKYLILANSLTCERIMHTRIKLLKTKVKSPTNVMGSWVFIISVAN